MASHARAGALIYAKDLARLSDFYQSVLVMRLLVADGEHHVIESADFQLMIHAIPPHIASTFEIATPPDLREEQAIKLFFTVADLSAAEGTARLLGGGVFEKSIQGPGFVARNGHDPEGNIFQLRQNTDFTAPPGGEAGVNFPTTFVLALVAYSVHEHQEDSGSADQIDITLGDGWCSVTDNGRGMGLHRPGYVDGLFEQLSTRKSAVALHGIGMAIVSMSSPLVKIESKRGGQILRQEFEWGRALGPVQSESHDGPSGTRVTVTLPDAAPAIDFDQVMAQAGVWRLANPGLRINVVWIPGRSPG